MKLNKFGNDGGSVLEKFIDAYTYFQKDKKLQLVLNKVGQKYIFRYDEGREDELLGSLIDAAKDERTDFDWFDAAVLSFKLTESLISQAYSVQGSDDMSNKDNRSDRIDLRKVCNKPTYIFDNLVRSYGISKN